MAADPYMKKCYRYDEGKCYGRVEWEHAIIFQGRQLNERWSIIPCCLFHHRGNGLNKEMNKWCALTRATIEELVKLSKANFIQERKYLIAKYGYPKILRES